MSRNTAIDYTHDFYAGADANAEKRIAVTAAFQGIRHALRRLKPQGNFYVNQTFQISFAYCAIVRSDENMPALAMFIRHLRAKDSSSR